LEWTKPRTLRSGFLKDFQCIIRVLDLGSLGPMDIAKIDSWLGIGVGIENRS